MRSYSIAGHFHNGWEFPWWCSPINHEAPVQYWMRLNTFVKVKFQWEQQDQICTVLLRLCTCDLVHLLCYLISSQLPNRLQIDFLFYGLHARIVKWLLQIQFISQSPGTITYHLLFSFSEVCWQLFSETYIKVNFDHIQRSVSGTFTK